MTKQTKIQMISQIISGARGDFARENGVQATINAAGRIEYLDRAKGYTRKISFSELLSYLHGEDIRALKAVL